jgi:hypothetical protein
MTHARIRWQAEGRCQRCGRLDLAWYATNGHAKRYKNCRPCRLKVAAAMRARHHAKRSAA